MKKLWVWKWSLGWLLISCLIINFHGIVQAADLWDFIPNELAFHVDFDQSNVDRIWNISPYTGAIVGYSDNWSGKYVAEFWINNWLAYSVTGNLQDTFSNWSGFTVVLRFKYKQLPNSTFYHSLGGRWVTTPADKQFAFWYYHGCGGSGSLCARTSLNGVDTTSAPLVVGAGALVTDKRYTLAYTYDGITSQKYFINGILEKEEQQVLNKYSNAPLEIGRHGSGSTDAIIGFSGYMDQFMIWSWELTEWNIKALGVILWGENGSGTNPPQQIDKLDQIFVNSEGLDIEYDIYYQTEVKWPIVITADSWDATKDNYRPDIKYMRDNYGFIGITINTRWKWWSQGNMDAFGYECKDIYELINYIENVYSWFYDSSAGVHIMGLSAAWGKALLCPGRYPDKFTSIFATAAVSSFTKWYEMNTGYQPPIRTRMGNSLSPWITFHPTGFPSVWGSIMNQEVYDSRDASLIGAYNTLAAVYLTHNIWDPIVDISLASGYDAARNSYSKLNNYSFETCNVATHDPCKSIEGKNRISSHTGVVNISSSWDFRIGGWVETKKFKIEFLKDVGYTGTLNYILWANDQFKFTINSSSYTGETEIVVKEITKDLDIFNNGVKIAELRNRQIQNSNAAYNILYSSVTKDLSIVLSATSQNIIEGKTPISTTPPTSSWWWGGGGWSQSKDNCPNGDFSPSYYDGTCWDSRLEEKDSIITSESWNATTENQNSMQESSNTFQEFSSEILTAYQRAFKNNITTLAPLENANPDWMVIRGHLAKMVVNYALNVLGRTLPEKIPSTCSRKDGSNARESEEIKDYAIKSCSLGLMGIDMEYFQPNALVSRAQFGTILSRLLRQNTYAGGSPYYAKHLQALKESGIMIQIDTPEARNELRQRVRLMLMRSTG